MSKFKYTTFIFICMVLFASCSVLNPMDYLIRKTSERNIKIGEVHSMEIHETRLSFDFPKDARGWACYVSGQEDFVRFDSPSVDIHISVRNTGENDFQLNVREIDENKVETFLLREGEEKLVYSGDFYTFLFEMHSTGRLKRVSNEMFTEWRPVFSIRSDVHMGSEISGEIILIPDNKIKLPSPVIFYAYIPPDTL